MRLKSKTLKEKFVFFSTCIYSYFLYNTITFCHMQFKSSHITQKVVALDKKWLQISIAEDM